MTPDEFPTLEAAAGLGLAIVLVRTGLLVRTLSSVGEETRNVVSVLQAGERDRALELATDEQADSFYQIARPVLIALRDVRAGEDRAAVHRRLGHAFDGAYVLQARRLQNGRARDWVALGILIGAVVYLAYAGLDVSTWFYGLCTSGAVFLTLNVILRGGVLRRMKKGRAPLLKAATDLALSSAPRRPLSSRLDERCPRCGAPLESQGGAASLELGGAQPFRAELTGVYACARCGHVHAVLSDPAALATSRKEPEA